MALLQGNNKKLMINNVIVDVFGLLFLVFFGIFRDFGFDPLGLGEVPENLERFKESELIHCRWAMLAVVSLSRYLSFTVS